MKANLSLASVALCKKCIVSGTRRNVIIHYYAISNGGYEFCAGDSVHRVAQNRLS